MAYQSLYRRYRPSRFSQVRGQGHVVTALLNAVRNDSATHAYLFSGPRGTGKTSTARILAKALNCENLQDGEPCGECQSCKDMEAGRSFDLFELDAASNNGVDAIRDLIERAAVGSPGRTKVYILDEVHMLSPAASNALLKTLEEPPPHVRFVLATTDPQKVLPTIKSRTQHFEFQLLSAEELEDYVRWIAQDAGLDIDDEAVRWAVRQGRGSARDTLSALDQVVAAGGVIERAEPVDQLLEALAEKSPGTAVMAIADALNLGHDPRVLGRAMLDTLRDLFLVSLGAPVPHLVPDDVAYLESWASRLGTALLTRSMEAIGSALVDMRQAADPRVPLEVAMVRLTSVESNSVAELVERIEKLEAAVANGAPVAARAPVDVAAAPVSVPAAETVRETAKAPAPESVRESPDRERAAQRRTEDAAARGDAASKGDAALSGPARARAELQRQRAARGEPVPEGPPRSRASENGSPSGRPPTGPPPSVPAPPRVPTASSPPEVPPSSPRVPAESREPAPQSSSSNTEPVAGQVTGGGAGDLTLETLSAALRDRVLAAMKGVAKAIYSQGEFTGVDGSTVTFRVENAPTRERAERSRTQVEKLLTEHFGRPVSLELVDSSGASPPSRPGGRAGPPQVPGDQPEDGRPFPNDERGPASIRPSRTPVPQAEPARDSAVPPIEDDYLTIDVSELEDATDVARTGLDRLLEAFPGATVLESESET